MKNLRKYNITLSTYSEFVFKRYGWVVKIKTSWKVINSNDYGVPQDRKRVYIIGHINKEVNIKEKNLPNKYIKDVQEKNLPPLSNSFTKLLLNKYTPKQLYGKSIKDKRGGKNNIHSWDIEFKGKLTNEQKEIMSLLLKERRKKKWADIKRIVWMDGMPLTLEEIYSFYNKIDINTYD